MTRKIKIDDAPTNKRKQWMECSKAELVFAIEKTSSYLRSHEEAVDRWMDRNSELQEELQGVKRAKKRSDTALFDQLDTTIGAMATMAKRMPEVSRFSYAMCMIRAIEVIITEFSLARPDLAFYENVATYYASEEFYNLCAMAKYKPKPGNVGYELLGRLQYLTEDDMNDANYYDYTTIYRKDHDPVPLWWSRTTDPQLGL